MCLGICLSFLTPGCHLLKEVIDPVADVTSGGGGGQEEEDGVTNKVSRGRRECLKSRENKQRFPVNEVHWGPVVWEREGLVLFKAKLLCYSAGGGERRGRNRALGLRVTGCNNVPFSFVTAQLGCEAKTIL